MKKIAITGLKYEWNLGDEIIYETVEYLISKYLKETHQENTIIIHSDIRSKIERNAYYKLGDKCLLFRDKVLEKIQKNEKENNINTYYFRLKFLKKYAELSEYYEEQIGEVDVIVISGGGLIKYKYEGLDYILENLIYYAQKKQIPVLINAVGIEGYDEEHLGCQLLKKYINQPCVKMITTRDNIKLLQEKWIENKEIDSGLVGDPALWAPETYCISKRESNIIGLGLIREEIFKVNGIDYDGEAFLDLWEAIVHEVEKRGYQWKLFLNGKERDMKFADALLNRLGCEKEQFLLVPESGKELTDVISNFKAVIACRLHAAIVSYALNVPVVELVWNEKQKHFGKIIDRADSFIEVEQFGAEKIVNQLEVAMEKGYDEKIKEKLKRDTYKELKLHLDEILGGKNVI